MKTGQRMLICVLYCHLHLKYKKKKELIDFFKSNVITYKLIMNNVLHTSGEQKNKKIKPNFLNSTESAIILTQELVIHYVDAFKNHTSRIIKPLKIKKSEYNQKIKIEAFCNLRKEKRFFLLERIRDMAVYNPNYIIL